MKIAVLGAGMVGGTLGERLASLGHEIRFGVPNPGGEKMNQLLAKIGASASAGTVSEAARDAEIVLLATPWDATQDAIRAAGDLNGKIIIDCTNPLKADAGGLRLALGYDISGAELVAGWAKGAHVCKAFNQTGFNNMAQPDYVGVRAVMFVCGDNEPSTERVRLLVESVGFEAINAGGLEVARLLEPLAMLWIHLAFNTDLKRDFAFAILRR